MLITIAQTLAGLVALYFGGEALVRGASGLASRMGVSPLAIGLTVVAFGTSAPELVVSMNAALSGAGDISVGNVVGSNIANIALILGLAALIRPTAVQARIRRIDAPLMILVSLALAGVMADGRVSRIEGLLLFLGLIIYVTFTFWGARRETHRVQEEFASTALVAIASVPASVFFVTLGFGLLVGGGHLLVTGAVRIAVLFGLSQATIGLTIVAVGTSLPELSTSVVAAARGQSEIAVGNVIGSNLFNILGILGATAMISPLQPGGITWIDIGVMIVVALIAMVMLTTQRRVGRVEGAILLASYVAYISWLLTR